MQWAKQEQCGVFVVLCAICNYDKTINEENVEEIYRKSAVPGFVLLLLLRGDEGEKNGLWILSGGSWSSTGNGNVKGHLGIIVGRTSRCVVTWTSIVDALRFEI